MDAQIGFADALWRVFPTTVSSHLQFRGWIFQETLCDRSSVTFDMRQCVIILDDALSSPLWSSETPFRIRSKCVHNGQAMFPRLV